MIPYVSPGTAFRCMFAFVLVLVPAQPLVSIGEVFQSGLVAQHRAVSDTGTSSIGVSCQCPGTLPRCRRRAVPEKAGGFRVVLVI